MPSARRGFGRDITLGGRDVVMAGDVRQMTGIGDESMFKEGPYRGVAQNRPRPTKRGAMPEVPPGTPSMEELTARGVAARESFEDVVILREVFRADRGSEDMSEADLRAYVKELEEFLDVTERMGNLTWTLEDHAWLSKLNRSARSEEERREFEDAPMLMGTRKERRGAAEGEEVAGADMMNERELGRLAQRTGEPILEVRGHHDKKEKDKDLRAELLPDDQFRRLEGTLRLCRGARVLLTHNLWVEAGLMNGALGYVAGYVWPEGGDPRSSDSRKRAPICIVVEFDDIDLGFEEKMENGRIVKARRIFPRSWAREERGWCRFSVSRSTRRRVMASCGTSSP